MKRNPRDPSAERKQASWESIGDLYGESDGVVDSEMELDTDKYESPIQRR